MSNPMPNGLSAADAEFLAKTFARRREEFGGWSMELDSGATPPAPEAGSPEAKQGDPAPEDLGDGGKKALTAERQARKAAEDQAKSLQAKLDEIARANETALEKAQREAKEAAEAASSASVAAFREAAVKFGGISAEDAELFLTGSDVATLEKQIERLKERTPAGPSTPKPDGTQGGGKKVGDVLAETSPGVGTLRAAYASES